MKTGIMLLCGLLLAACSDPAAPGTKLPVASREFDPRLPGVQITRIYYDEAAVEKSGAIMNEYVVLQSANPVTMKGWKIKPAGHGLITINANMSKMLTLYTQYQDGLPTPDAISLNMGYWIWKNDHDTAILYNDKEAIVSKLAY